MCHQTGRRDQALFVPFCNFSPVFFDLGHFFPLVCHLISRVWMCHLLVDRYIVVFMASTLVAMASLASFGPCYCLRLPSLSSHPSMKRCASSDGAGPPCRMHSPRPCAKKREEHGRPNRGRKRKCWGVFFYFSCLVLSCLVLFVCSICCLESNTSY